MACGVPIFAINPIPGQEEENAEFLEEEHFAVWLKSKESFEEKLKEIIQDDELNKLKESTSKYTKANAAYEICTKIFEA